MTDMENPKELTEKEWREQLTDEEYQIIRLKGTERAGTGKFLNHNDQGIYTCRACGAELFSSKTKYKSGSGWPSFYDVLDSENVSTETDTSHGMTRTEIICNKCGGHLGHLFDDGPRPTGKRYCVNSASLDFKKD